jgi:hypothetical protein
MTQPAIIGPQFRDTWYASAPSWLQTGDAEKYMYVLELMRDLLLEKADEAITIRIPGQGDPSQIPWLAYDRQLVQGPAEPNANFIIRLQQSIPTWNEAGSALAVLGELQPYMQELQPGVPAAYPEIAVVSNPRGGSTTWNTIYQGQTLQTPPNLMTVPVNFSWDGNNAATWRAWLVLYMSSVATGVSGSAGATGASSGASFTVPGQLVSGVWVPTTSGTPVNTGFLLLTGLAGLPSSCAGSMITISGSSNPTNNGTFQIAEYISATSCIIANPTGVASDTGPLTWSVATYPWMAPGPAFGTPNLLWGQGELTPPTIDTGSNVGGIWQPTTLPGSGSSPIISWGLSISANLIVSIRGILKTWKSGGTYYPNIIISFGGGNNAAGNAYSPLSAEGSGNPNGTFGSVGSNVSGTWEPTRYINNVWDCFCQGTGVAVGCGVENYT